MYYHLTKNMRILTTRIDAVSNGVVETAGGLKDFLFSTIFNKKIYTKIFDTAKSVGKVGLAVGLTIGEPQRGILNPKNGYNLKPWEKESIWNPMRHVRKAVAGATNIVGESLDAVIGIISEDTANSVHRTLNGIVQGITGPIIGEFHEDLLDN